MTNERTDPEAMTDTELIEALAVKVMGWAEVPFEIECSCAARDSLEWNPLTDWNDTMQVAMQAIEIHLTPALVRICCTLTIKGKKGEAVDDDPQRAICLAALRAVRSLKKP